tara:strand:- start:18796 stop:19140 length:345 start_codon:yes stop_codon:yes gene_type:complete
MSLKDPKRLAPFSLRLTKYERKALELRAGEMALGSYVRSVLFGEVSGDKRISHAQILAKLGQSEMADSMRELARCAQLGMLPVTPETESAIRQACVDIAEIKSLLMKALRIKEH